MSLKKTLIGGLAVAAMTTAISFADGADLPFAMHDMNVTYHTPTINITVRNVANSTDPADRDLRVVSNANVDINIQGQVWCNSYDHAETAALRAHALLSHVNIISAPGGGTTPFLFGPPDAFPDHTQTFNGTNTLENFDINFPLELATMWDSDALIDMALFNAVRSVEEHLENFTDNNAGSEADFLRQDDVFEVQLPVSAVGWCSYESNILDNEYAGARYLNVTAAIFYQGDDDIQDVIGTVSGANTVAAPTPSRARGTTTTRGSSATPPARNTRPARAQPSRSDRNKQQRRAPARGQNQIDVDSGTGGSASVSSYARVDGIPGPASNSRLGNDGLDTDSDGATALVGLLLPAVQSAREAARGSQTPGVEPDEIDAPSQANTGVEPDEIDARATAPQSAALDALRIINEVDANTDQAGRGDSGEAHLDYLVIIMEAAVD